MTKFSKSKVGEQVGFKVPNFIRGKNFGQTNKAKFNPAIFKVQHKG